MESFIYQFGATDDIMYFSISFPYVRKHFDAFYGKIKIIAPVQYSTLITSEQGREVPLYILGNPSAERNILITCRHHACESSASYLLEGLMDALVRSRSKLLEEYRFHIVPFVDSDGVENGDQGKTVFRMTTAVIILKSLFKRQILQLRNILAIYHLERLLNLDLHFLNRFNTKQLKTIQDDLAYCCDKSKPCHFQILVVSIQDRIVMVKY